DVDRGVAVIGHHPFGHQDRVLEVVAVPRHERDQHVLAQRQLTHIGGRAVGDDVSTRHQITLGNQRTLVDIGVLVGTGVFDQVVDINPDFTGRILIVIHTNHDTLGIHVVDHAAATG